MQTVFVNPKNNVLANAKQTEFVFADNAALLALKAQLDNSPEAKARIKSARMKAVNLQKAHNKIVERHAAMNGR